VGEFKKQIAAGIPMAVGSDVGPFPHGTQARELVLLVKYGMSAIAVLQADLLNGAKLLGWEGQIGSLEPGYLADVIAITGDPLEDISAVSHVAFVMKAGIVYKKEGAVPKTEKAQHRPRKPCTMARDHALESREWGQGNQNRWFGFPASAVSYGLARR
jgi:cytosine/adenosine deaminase-related metal-dependent hydrolase